ncbi:FISUMP domain-containing protein [Flavobacterium sp.]|uniref:FISUMP domain-containing protein n=1 Tax=Flavobacterium sp. TaxID=239 RepID=UPI0025D53F13|nr:FISUMP domain-containing protein [Flavobacterium sp.]
MNTKNLFFLFLSILLISGCSTNSDGNGNSTTTVVPIAPSNLNGTVVASTTQINLSWTDNSTNETGFKIERKTGAGTYAVVGTTATDINTFSDTGLTPCTTYTYRIYSYNSVGNSPTYSNELILNTTSCTTTTDIDGNIYQLVTICDQTWTKTNLNVSKYRNGDVIPQVTNPTEWTNLTTGAWCYHLNNTANGAIYGKLYNWYAVNDPRGLAPVGYHIPSDAEWTTLTTCLGGETVAGGKMKETSTTHWTSPNTGATNSSGFTGLPGGYRGYGGGAFYTTGDQGFWWSSLQVSAPAAWARNLRYDSGTAGRDYSNKSFGFSVRCVRD